MLDEDFLGSPEAIRARIRLIAAILKKHADELMDMYIALKESTEVEQTPQSLAIKKVFDDSEREGVHRKLLFNFHDLVYELHNAVTASPMVDDADVLNLLQLTFASEQAYNELRKSGERHVKLAQAAAKAATAQN